MLPLSSPLKCTSPSDVYLLLKSSDFINHDLSAASVFAGCAESAPYELELVLRKWYPIDRSRELRCFVRRNVLVGEFAMSRTQDEDKLTYISSAISQRDNNYYDFLNDLATRESIKHAVQEFWETNIRDSEYWKSNRDCGYPLALFWSFKCAHHMPNIDIFDFLLTRDLSRGHILDFNPYAPRTDPLLFTYEELADTTESRLVGTSGTTTASSQEERDESCLPDFRVIDSHAHPAATSNTPAYQHNMVPFEVLNLSSGKDIEEFADSWKDEVQKSLAA